MVSDFRGLRIWTESLELVDAAYDMADSLPTSERYGLASQLRRAAVSVVANIAEGNGRVHRREYVHHLSIARGSVAELCAHAIVAERRRMVHPGGTSDLQRRCDIVSRMLRGMIRRLTA